MRAPDERAALRSIYIYIHSLLLGRREEGEILHPFARVNTVDPRRLDLDVAQRTIGRGDSSLRLRVLLLRRNFLTREENFNDFFLLSLILSRNNISQFAGKFSKRRIDFSVHIESWIRIIRYKRSFSPSLPPVELL